MSKETTDLDLFPMQSSKKLLRDYKGFIKSKATDTVSFRMLESEILLRMKQCGR